jgi:hypothetical protein
MTGEMTPAQLAELPPYTPTAEQSADIKMILKLDPVTPDIERMAEVHATEAEEAVAEVLAGFAEAEPGSWAAREAQR